MIRFLTKETIIEFHDDQVKLYGGSPGVRSHELSESALAQPKASFGGEYVHETIFDMAAAYGYHICQNHPFFDGNKRTALIAIYTFLHVNGFRLIADKKSLYATIVELASGKLEKKELALYLKTNSKEIEK